MTIPAAPGDFACREGGSRPAVRPGMATFSPDAGIGERVCSMNSADGYVDGVEVLWRPGCPFCTKLRRGLRRHGVITTEVDIWEDPRAAERVRAVAGGNETVPTVFVGNCALVNPSVRAVVAAIEREFPDRAQEMMAGSEDSDRRSWRSRLFSSGHGE